MSIHLIFYEFNAVIITVHIKENFTIVTDFANPWNLKRVPNDTSSIFMCVQLLEYNFDRNFCKIISIYFNT